MKTNKIISNMKTKKIMSELDNLCGFVLKSNSIDDFNVRFEFLLSMALLSFKSEIEENNTLPFNSYIFIFNLNKKLNAIIKKIRDNMNKYIDEFFQDDIFLFILMDEYPEYYKNYMYQMSYRRN